MKLPHEQRQELETKLAAMTVEQAAESERVIESKRLTRSRELAAQFVSEGADMLTAELKADSISKYEADEARKIVQDKRLAESQNVLEAMFPAAGELKSLPPVKMGSGKPSDIEIRSKTAMDIASPAVKAILAGKPWSVSLEQQQ